MKESAEGGEGKKVGRVEEGGWGSWLRRHLLLQFGISRDANAETKKTNFEGCGFGYCSVESVQGHQNLMKVVVRLDAGEHQTA